MTSLVVVVVVVVVFYSLQVFLDQLESERVSQTSRTDFCNAVVQNFPRFSFSPNQFLGSCELFQKLTNSFIFDNFSALRQGPSNCRIFRFHLFLLHDQAQRVKDVTPKNLFELDLVEKFKDFPIGQIG